MNQSAGRRIKIRNQTVYSIRLPVPVREALQRQANAANMILADYIRAILVKTVTEGGANGNADSLQ